MAVRLNHGRDRLDEAQFFMEHALARDGFLFDYMRAVVSTNNFPAR
jgi:hypothetical protein